MAVSLSVSKSYSASGKTLSESKSIVADGQALRDKSIPAAKAGTLTTRTDDDTGVITVGAGIGAQFVATDRVDVHWLINGVAGCRRGMKVSSVAGDAITVGTVGGDIGAGDIFPAAASAVAIVKPTMQEFRFDGADLKAIVVQSTFRGVFVITDAADAEDHFFFLPSDAKVGAWTNDDGTVNPFTLTVAKVYMSHGDTANAGTMTAMALFS